MIDIKVQSKFGFDLNITVLSKSKEGKNYRLYLHTNKDKDSKENIYLNYLDKIEKGDIIYKKVSKAINEDFGISKIKDIEFVETPIEDPDDLEKENFKYDIFIIVDHNPDYEKEIGDVYSSWVEIIE